MQVHYTEDADADMRAIIGYGVENDLPDPVGYVQALRMRTGKLAAIGHRGRTGRVPGTLEWVLAGTPYIVVFVKRGARIEVWRMLHGARQ